MFYILMLTEIEGTNTIDFKFYYFDQGFSLWISPCLPKIIDFMRISRFYTKCDTRPPHYNTYYNLDWILRAL